MSQRTNIKASHLWNVQEPGDPYDIRKSMIARLPDHPTKPMGQYLDIVCLMQAAEIERLSDYLTELQYKYREIERRELDRHSYEIQIKELAEKSMAYNTLKIENERLKDFIRRQSQQLQQLQKINLQSMSFETHQTKYQGLLNELRIGREQNQRSEKLIAKLNYQVAQWKTKWERSELQKSNLKNQFQFQISQRVTIQIKLAREKAEQRINKLQLEVRQLKDYLQSKNQEIQILTSQRDQLNREIKLLEQKNRSRGNIEENINEKNRQIQRLNLLISEYGTKLDQALGSLQMAGGEIRVLEERYVILERQKQSLVIRLRQAEHVRLKNQTLDKYEQKVAMMSMEIERLNGLNATKARELTEVTIEMERFRLELSKANSNREQAERHENKIFALTKELQRVTLQLKAKNQQIYAFQQKSKLSELSASQMASLATDKSRLEQQLQATRSDMRNYKTITDSELNTLKTEYNRLRHELQQNTTNRGDVQKYKLECERLKFELQKVKSESLSVRRTIEEQKNNSLSLASQKNKLVQERSRLGDQNKRLGLEIAQLRRDMEQLKVKARGNDQLEQMIQRLQMELQSKVSRNEQVQATIESIYKQIERLHAVLATKTAELMRMAKDYNQLEQKCRFLQAKLSSSANQKEFYEREMNKLKTQIESFSRFKTDTFADLERKNSQISSERERYELLLAQKDKLMAEYVREKDKLIAQHIKENDNLQRKLIDLQRQITHRISFQEQTKQDYDRIVQDFRNKEAIILQLQTVIRQKEIVFSQSQGKVKHWENRVTEWESRLKDAERGLLFKDQERDKLNQEINRLYQECTRLKARVEELTANQRGRFSNEENIRTQLQHAQQTISLQRSEIQNLRMQVRRLQQVINRQTRQLQSLRQSAKEHQLKIVHIENTNSKVLQDRLRQQELKLQERDQLIISLQKQNNQLQGQIPSLLERDKAALSNLTHYQEQINVLYLEFDRLNKVIEEKTRECREKDKLIDALRQQMSQYASMDNSDKYRIEIANLKTALQELENINHHTIAERDELFRMTHQLKAQYDGHLAKVADEDKRLRVELQFRLEETRKFGQEMGMLRKKEQNYLLKIRQLQEGSSTRQAEEPILRRRISQLQQLIDAYTKRINDLSIQNTNLRTEVNQVQVMMQQLKTRGETTSRHEMNSLGAKLNEYMELAQSKEEELTIWQNKYTALYSAYEELYTNYNLTKSEYEITINNVRVYQSKLFKLQQDFSGLGEALRLTQIETERYKKENYELRLKLQGDGDLYEKNLLLSKQIDRLTELNREMQRDLSDIKVRLTDQVSLKKRMQEHMGLFVVMFAEIESLRSRLANSEQQCEDVRRSSLAPLRVDRSPGSRH